MFIYIFNTIYIGSSLKVLFVLIGIDIQTFLTLAIFGATKCFGPATRWQKYPFDIPDFKLEIIKSSDVYRISNILHF